MSCPIPIRLLDALDGADDPQAVRHLDDCPVCRRHTEALALIPAPAETLALPVAPSAFLSFDYDASERPDVGDLWLAGLRDEPIRHDELSSMVVYVASSRPAAPNWLDCIPFTWDTEAAGDQDVIIDERRSPWRQPFRLMVPLTVPVAYRNLLAHAGRVDADVITLIESAVSGHADDDLHGSSWEDPDDWRAEADRPHADMARRLRSLWLAAIEREPSDELKDEGDPVGVEEIVDAGIEQELASLAPIAELLDLEMQLAWTPEPPGHSFKLAASTRRVRMQLEATAPDVGLTGRVLFDLARDLLTYACDQAPEGLGALRMHLTFADGSHAASDPFVAEPGGEFPLAEGTAHSARDISAIRLTTETESS